MPKKWRAFLTQGRSEPMSEGFKPHGELQALFRGFE